MTILANNGVAAPALRVKVAECVWTDIISGRFRLNYNVGNAIIL